MVEVTMVAVIMVIMVEFHIVMVMVILLSSSCGPKGLKSWLKGLKIGSEGPPTKNLAPEKPNNSSIRYSMVYSFWYIYTFKSWVSGHIGGALTSCFALRWSFTSVPPGCAHHSGQIKTTIVIVVIIIVIIIVLCHHHHYHHYPPHSL